MKSKIFFILFALILQYVADYTFLYQVSRQVWSISGINDLMYFVAYFFMTIGLLQFKVAFSEMKHVSQKK